MPPSSVPSKWRVTLTWTPPDSRNGTGVVLIQLMAFDANDMLARAKMHAGAIIGFGGDITWSTPLQGWTQP